MTLFRQKVVILYRIKTKSNDLQITIYLLTNGTKDKHKILKQILSVANKTINNKIRAPRRVSQR